MRGRTVYSMASISWYLVICLQLLAVFVTSLSSMVAEDPPQKPCPHQCSCTWPAPQRIQTRCKFTSKSDWNEVGQQLMNYSRHTTLIDLKVLDNASSVAFEAFPPLHNLDMSFTNLNIIDNIFSGLIVSNSLNLSSNGIIQLPENAFSTLDRLAELDLSHNFITMFNPEVFQGLSSLKIMHLGFNNLNKLSKESFWNIPNLEYLGLEYNKISEFSTLFLSRSAFLRSLNLKGNSLLAIMTDINETHSSLLSNLTFLDISDNPLECSCALGNMLTAYPNLSKILVNPSVTVCASPEVLKGQNLLNIDKSELTCTAPNSIISFPASSKDIVSSTVVTLHCQVKGYPKPSIMWITPWNDRFFYGSRLLLDSLGVEVPENVTLYSDREYTEPAILTVSSIRLTPDNDLVITNIRGHQSGNYTCLAFNLGGSAYLNINLSVFSVVTNVVMHSMFIGGYCASGFLIIGFIVGFIKMMVGWMRHRLYFIVPMFSKSPSTKQAENTSTESSLNGCTNRSLSDDSKPEDHSPSSSCIVNGKDFDGSEEDDTFDVHGGWLPQGFYDSYEEAKGRLRYGVGRSMERMRKNVQSFRESGSVYVQNIVDSGNSAASRMRAGVVFGVETVKYHVQSFKELCGTGDMGTQTISMVSVETDVDSNQQKEVIRQVTFV